MLNETEFEQNKFSRRRETAFMESRVYIISPEDLLLSKLVWIQQLQSAQQMEDIKTLFEIESLDKDYIQFWIDKLLLTTFDLL